jgi:hypothetical protein
VPCSRRSFYARERQKTPFAVGNVIPWLTRRDGIDRNEAVRSGRYVVLKAVDMDAVGALWKGLSAGVRAPGSS